MLYSVGILIAVDHAMRMRERCIKILQAAQTLALGQLVAWQVLHIVASFLVTTAKSELHQ